MNVLVCEASEQNLQGAEAGGPWTAAYVTPNDYTFEQKYTWDVKQIFPIPNITTTGSKGDTSMQTALEIQIQPSSEYNYLGREILPHTLRGKVALPSTAQDSKPRKVLNVLVPGASAQRGQWLEQRRPVLQHV